MYLKILSPLIRSQFKFLRDVDSMDLVIALKGSNEEVQNIIYANMSKRMSETIQEDQQYLRGVRLRDVEEAQQRIVGIIRKLEEAGEIFISVDERMSSLSNVVKFSDVVEDMSYSLDYSREDQNRLLKRPTIIVCRMPKGYSVPQNMRR